MDEIKDGEIQFVDKVNGIKYVYRDPNNGQLKTVVSDDPYFWVPKWTWAISYPEKPEK